MIDIPLIFIHNGNQSYLQYAIHHAYFFNPDGKIYLLGDLSNSDIKRVEHHFSETFLKSAKAFEEVYEHMSPNSYEFELRCFQRWFIINEFVREKRLTHFLCLDSDVLLFCNVKEVFNNFLNYDFTISRDFSPHVALFNADSLSQFCNYLQDLYTRPEYLERLRRYYQNCLQNAKNSGVSDMTAFDWYKDISSNVKEISDPEDRFFFDGNMNDEDGFEMAGGLKRIFWQANLPFGRTKTEGLYIRMQALHFQGAAKRKIRNYVSLKVRLEKIIRSLRRAF